MSKKNVITVTIFLILGYISIYVVGIIDFLIHQNLSGDEGFPLKYGSNSFFGGSSTDYRILFLDVIFWAIVLFLIWKIFLKIIRKNSLFLRCF